MGQDPSPAGNYTRETESMMPETLETWRHVDSSFDVRRSYPLTR